MQTGEIILMQFPGVAMVPITTAGKCIGYKKQTTYNLFHKGKFPLPVKKIGRKSMVAIADLIKFIDGPATNAQVAPIVQTPSEPKRRVGRPTKAEQVRRMRGLD
jgi:hypothetical protein